MKYSKLIVLLIGAMLLFSSCGKVKSLFTSTKKYQKLTAQKQYEKALDFYDRGRYEKALSLLGSVRNFFAGDARLDTIMFYSANCFYYNRDYLTSSEMYNQYRVSMGRGKFYVQADLYYALSLYKISPDVKLDQSYTKQAITAFKDFLYRHPDHEMTQQCQEYIDELYKRVYDNQLDIAKTYYDIGYYNSAIVCLKNILKTNPETPLREDVMYYIVKANYEYARSSITAKRRERFFDTIDAFYNFADEFPESNYLEHVKKLHIDAQNMADGTAYISDLTSKVVSKNQSLYDKRDKLMEKVAKLEKKGKDSKSLRKYKDELDVTNKAIRTVEELIAKRKKEVEISQAR